MKSIPSSKNRSFAFVILFSLLLILTFVPAGVALANAPVPLHIYQIMVYNAPEGAYGVDLLVLSEEMQADGIYTGLNKDMLEEAGLPADCGLSGYDEDGFVSFGCHYSEDTVYGSLDEDFYNQCLFAVYSNDASFDWLKERKQHKLAVYDSEGNILSVSDSFTMRGVSGRYKGQLQYDCESGDITIAGKVVNGKGQSSPGHGLSLFSCMGRSSSGAVRVQAATLKDSTGGYDTASPGLAIFLLLRLALFTALIEFLVALLFRIRPVWIVPIVTFVSNIIMNLIIFRLYRSGINYWTLVIIGEICAIIAEMLVYFLIYKNISKRKLALFSLAANIASFALGQVLALLV